MEVKACPSCRSTGALPTGGEVRGFVAAAGEREFFQEAYSVRECRRCGLLYKNPTLSPAEFADYYARTDFRRWETKGLFPSERALLRILRGLPRGSRILDVGCSSGRLLAPLVGSYRCFGYELNEAAIREARAKGLTMLSAGDLEAPPGGAFDAIVMVDVFEHLQSPVELLAKYVGLLRPGGRLILVTGDGDARYCRYDPAQFWYFLNIEHVAMLTRRHAAWLEQQLEIRLTRWETVCHYDWKWRSGISQMLKHWAYWRFRRGSQAVKAALRRLPGLRKAEFWELSPGFVYSSDHVVAVFEK